MVAGLYLAAGAGERFGASKLLHELEGRPLFCHGLAACVASRLDEICVVTGDDPAAVDAAIGSHFPGEARIRLLVNRDAGAGMMSSLKTGISSLGERVDGAMVVLADMPRMTGAIIDQLLHVFEQRHEIVVPECGGIERHPRVLPRDLFPEFLALGDDEKGMQILDAHGDRVVRVEIGQKDNYIDIDTPEDLERLVKHDHTGSE
jgi:molybdenum cofactor cytidylyltransferase